MRVLLAFLARRRWAGVGLALVAEILLLVALARVAPSAAIGIPAAVAAGIGGTVAVVFAVVDGVAVATVGAITFAALGGWGAGELAAIGVWPLIVAAVGLFARRVERQRAALRQMVEAQEDERRSLALTLHDESAQTLAGALLTLRAGQVAHDSAGIEADQARELIIETIQQLRRLALELSPKALEDYGLASALAHLADTASSSCEASVEFVCDWDERLSHEAERALFRFAKAALDAALERHVGSLTMKLSNERGRVTVTIGAHDGQAAAPPPRLPSSLDERLRLLGGKLSTHRNGDSGLVLRAEVPAELRLLGRIESVA
jgi:signal transduction histidine kinase